MTIPTPLYRIVDLNAFVGNPVGTELIEISTAGAGSFKVPLSTLSNIAAGEFYVDGLAGNDSNLGTSPSAAWKTIAKVNASTFTPGQSILFAGGQTFSGAIVCPSSGTASSPITFGSYGGGQATISSGTSTGFTSSDQSGIIVRDLTFTGSGSTGGVLFQTSSGAARVRRQNIQAINLTVSGYGFSGIAVANLDATFASGYDDVFIEGCTVSNCATGDPGSGTTAGINIGSSTFGLALNPPSFTNVIVSNCITHDNPGATSSGAFATGSGIVLSECLDALVVNCLAYNNGASSNGIGGGPTGIWTFDSTNVVFDSCVSHHTSTGNATDGGGFDFDYGCTNCICINCYSHDNVGFGFFIFNLSIPNANANTGSQIINCVSLNDASGGIKVSMGSGTAPTGIAISGCSISSTAGSGSAQLISILASGVTGIICNNKIVANVATTILVNTSTANPTGVTFIGNDYWSAFVKIVWNNITYTDVGSWSAATGKENGRFSANIYYASFFFGAGPSGSFPGVYIDLPGVTTNQRLVLSLDGSDRPTLFLGSGAAPADVALTRTGTGQVSLATGTSNPIVLGRDAAAATYNILSFNGQGTDSGGVNLGILAGASGDNVMYLEAPSTGGFKFSVGTTSYFAIGATGSAIVNNAAINTNATDGFLYIPTCAGTPTGTPTAFTGRVPMVFDTTNSQFWFYTGGAWKQPKTPSAAAIVTWQ